METPGEFDGRGSIGGGDSQRIEQKVLDVEIDGAPVNSGGGIVLLNGCVRGSDIFNRIGRKVVFTSILLRLQSYNQALNNPLGNAIRTVVFYDRQTNGVAPVLQNILSSNNGLAAVPTPQTPYNLNARNRFIIIYDKYWGTHAASYSAGQVSGGDPQTITHMFHKRLNLETIYSGNTGLVGDIQTGGIFVLIIADGSNTQLIDFHIRLRFVDA